jgi:ankyrin repeat protein
MGYPTHPVDRAARLFDPDFPSYKQDDFENIFGTLDGSQSPNIPTNEHMRSGLCPLPEGNMLVDSTYSWPHLCEAGSPAMGQSLEGTPVSRKMLARESRSESESVCRSGPKITSAHFDQLCSLWSSSTASTSSQSWSLPSSAFDHSCEFPASSMELNGAAYFNMSNSSNELNITASGNTGEHTHLGLNYLDFGLNGVAAAGHGPSPLCASMDLDHDPMSPHDTTGQFQQTSRPNETKMPFPHSSNASSAAGTRTKLRSFFRPRSSGFSRGKKRYPTSEYTFNTEDSGYASGFTSCLSLPDIQQEDPQSLSEFNGLYRVACQNLHEPQGMAKFRDIPTCKYCRYSSILNLGWSSRYLKFEVFLSELRLEGVYEFGALDAAGNTALHYAAAGGGSFLHLKALIDAGVDPYAANTAGELFIYCLRPLQPFTLELNPDCLKGNDLINLLKLLQPERVVGWRDNNGQTIFHALALKVTDPELKAKIFR